MDKIFEALSYKCRRQILTELKKNGEMTVTQILKLVSVSQPTLSSHLAVLRGASLVNVRIRDRWRYYSLDTEVWRKFIGELSNFIGSGISEEIKLRKP